MLLDSTHRVWFIVTLVLGAVALGFYLTLSAVTPGGLTGGSSVGLWYGSIGSALMIYAGLLAAHRRLPRWTWLGARQAWLRGHIWLGLLSAAFLICHGRFRLGGTLTTLLWVVYTGVMVSGVFGLVLQQVVPRALTTRVSAEAPYEQIPHLCRLMRRRADALVDEICGPVDDEAASVESTRAAARLAEDGQVQLRAFYERDVRSFLTEAPPRSSPLFNPLQTEARFGKLRNLAGLDNYGEQLDQLAGLCEERRQLREQERLHGWLHGWLLLHVPLSAALLVLGVVHAAVALYY
jgi:hypothetical protein